MLAASHNDRGFILLHGGGLGIWAWQPVIPLLQLPALALDLPGRHADSIALKSLTLADCTSAIVAASERAPFQQVILVAHSLCGALAPAVAARLAQRLEHLVFLAVCIPAQGQCVEEP